MLKSCLHSFERFSYWLTQIGRFLVILKLFNYEDVSFNLFGTSLNFRLKIFLDLYWHLIGLNSLC